MAHVNTLSMLLGGMIIDRPFRESMITDTDATLDHYCIRLTPTEYRAMRRMVGSFGAGRCLDAVAQIAAECPDWPCSEYQLSSSEDCAALPADQQGKA